MDVQINSLYHFFWLASGFYTVQNDAEYQQYQYIRKCLMCLSGGFFFLWTFHALDFHRESNSWRSYLLGDIAVPFGNQYRPIFNAAISAIAVTITSLFVVDKISISTHTSNRAINQKSKVLIVTIISFTTFTAVIFMFCVFIIYYPWASVWPPYCVTTPLWLAIYLVAALQGICAGVNVFGSILIEFNYFSHRILTVMEQFNKVRQRPAKKLVTLRHALIDWNNIRVELLASSCVTSKYLAVILPPFIINVILMLYFVLFLTISFTTKAEIFTVVFATGATCVLLLGFASQIPWRARRYTMILNQISASQQLAGIRFVGIRKFLLKQIQYGEPALPEYKIDFCMSISYLNVLYFILEISTYFLLLITTIGIPSDTQIQNLLH